MSIDKQRKARKAKQLARAKKRAAADLRRSERLEQMLQDAFARRGYRGALDVLGSLAET